MKAEIWAIDYQRRNAERIMARGQSCKCCLRQQRFEFSVSDEIWQRYIPEPLKNYSVCIECFLNFTKGDVSLRDIKIIDIVNI